MASRQDQPQRRTPLDRPVDLVLHAGSGKTGSTSIQRFLRGNRARLSEFGVLFPQTPGRGRHYRFNLFVQPDDLLDSMPTWKRERERYSTPEEFRETFRRQFIAEIKRSGLARVLVSDESLYGSGDQALRRLGRFSHRLAASIRVVVYLRRQDDHLVSRYQQGVKVGWVQRLAEWSREDLSSIYDHDARLGTWERLVEPDSVVVRRFEPASFVGGSLQQDFLDAAGVGVRLEELKPHTSPLNQSLDAESVEFLRILNLYRVENEGARAGLIDNRRLVKRLAPASTGPVLTLPTAALDAFMAQWEESNQRVARRYLGDRDGQLFHLPRKSDNTTTEQRLDPARLDHFLDLVELPEPMHAPLRQLAEREAKVG